MNDKRPSENVTLFFGVAVMILMLLYAFGTEVLFLNREGCRSLLFIALVISMASFGVRCIRLRRIGGRLLFLEPPGMEQNQQRKFLLLLCCSAVLGAYSVHVLLLGSISVGVLGCVAAVSSMVVLTRGILRQKVGVG